MTIKHDTNRSSFDPRGSDREQGSVNDVQGNFRQDNAEYRRHVLVQIYRTSAALLRGCPVGPARPQRQSSNDDVITRTSFPRKTIESQTHPETLMMAHSATFVVPFSYSTVGPPLKGSMHIPADFFLSDISSMDIGSLQAEGGS
jgi:hypothetical protein